MNDYSTCPSSPSRSVASFDAHTQGRELTPGTASWVLDDNSESEQESESIPFQQDKTESEVTILEATVVNVDEERINGGRASSLEPTTPRHKPRALKNKAAGSPPPPQHRSDDSNGAKAMMLHIRELEEELRQSKIDQTLERERFRIVELEKQLAKKDDVENQLVVKKKDAENLQIIPPMTSEVNTNTTSIATAAGSASGNCCGCSNGCLGCLIALFVILGIVCLVASFLFIPFALIGTVVFFVLSCVMCCIMCSNNGNGAAAAVVVNNNSAVSQSRSVAPIPTAAVEKNTIHTQQSEQMTTIYEGTMPSFLGWKLCALVVALLIGGISAFVLLVPHEIWMFWEEEDQCDFDLNDCCDDSDCPPGGTCIFSSIMGNFCN